MNGLKKRRSIYEIDDKIKVSEDEIIKKIEEITELVPDAYNLKSQHVVMIMGKRHKEYWDKIHDIFEGKVSREKIDSFKNGAGTILFFYDSEKVKGLEEKFPKYKDNFKPWALQANGMLQINIWSHLAEMGLGASLQHYNPVIDEMVQKDYKVDKKYVLLAQLVFGNPLSYPEEKEKEDISKRVIVFK